MKIIRYVGGFFSYFECFDFIDCSFYFQTDFIPFDRYFKVESISKYHPVVTLEYFMDRLAKIVWPVGESSCLLRDFDG